MKAAKVYYQPITNKSKWNSTAKIVLKKLIADSKIKLEKDITLKIHSGEPGNISFIKPKYMNAVIDYLEEENVKTVFMETNTAGGPRSTGKNHRQIAKTHGFTRIPFIVADGDDGRDQVLVSIKNGKHFKQCKIARKLHESKQVLVISHFKGHCMTGYGGAIKMLGIGYASKRGKIEAHAIPEIPENETIDWDKAKNESSTGQINWNEEYVYANFSFMERTAEYALAAKKPNDIHLIYAVSLVENCDCDSTKMTPIYADLGVFASRDPVAIDKAMLDMLDKRQGKATYTGRYILDYAQKIGLGSKSYQLIKV